MSSLAARNIGRLLPRLVRAAERQRHLSSLAPISVTRKTPGIQQTLRTTSLGSGYSSTAVLSNVKQQTKKSKTQSVNMYYCRLRKNWWRMAGKSPHLQVTRPRWWTGCCTAWTWRLGGRGGSPGPSLTRSPHYSNRRPEYLNILSRSST